MLKRRGIERVRPLEGGLDRWIELGFPTEPAQHPPRLARTDGSDAEA